MENERDVSLLFTLFFGEIKYVGVWCALIFGAVGGTLNRMLKQNSLLLYGVASQVKEFAQAKSEHDLRVKVKDAFFGDYAVDVEDERINFLVYYERRGIFTETLMWAESKDKPTDVFEMFAQLLLTIKKKIDTGEMPPKYLGVFDKEKIAFTEYSNALTIFNLNDFNWTERPSSVSKKTVNQVAKYLKRVVQYRFESDSAEIRGFIRENFVAGSLRTRKAQINKNNFVSVYFKWVKEVLPSIGLSAETWKKLKDSGVGDCDFYLADLLSENNKTIVEKLNIVLQTSHYKSKVSIEGEIETLYRDIGFKDKGVAHTKFWARYERPPKKDYHQHIIERRDLLVPQDIRERIGAYFTPQIWVEKSQEYLAKVFGENWQEEYYIWDCCAGTCNLLVGLTEKHRVWASTIDQPDVDIVHEIIDRNALNLLKSHVFRFDFLNDDFSELPKSLRDVIKDKKKREKLIIYMNPPYAEAGSTKQRSGTGKNKDGVATAHKIKEQYGDLLGKASNEIFAQFFMRIIQELPGAKLASFSKLKYINSQNFIKFRGNFLAEYHGGFMCPANTFDNVEGKFPIGFLIWDTAQKQRFRKVKLEAFDRTGKFCEKKTIHNIDGFRPLTSLTKYESSKKAILLGHFAARGCDFQNQQAVFIDNLEKERKGGGLHVTVSNENIIDVAISFAVRHCIKHTWINDRDQFFYPKGNYDSDKEFQNDCLTFMLFHHQNRICSWEGVNHWIPFTEKGVEAKDNFQSTFMSDFLKKRKRWSTEAKDVFNAGKRLWKYYHETIKNDDDAPVDASLYEIREYFKGRDETGRMKTKATDEEFNYRDRLLRGMLQLLAKNIEPKVYQYGFLKK